MASLMLSRSRSGGAFPTRARIRLITSPARLPALIMRSTDSRAAFRLGTSPASQRNVDPPTVLGKTYGLAVLNPFASVQAHQNLLFLLVQLGRNDAGNWLTDHLVCLVAEDICGACIPRGDCAVESLADNRVIR